MEIENAIQNRMNSFNKFKSVQQRRRRMSVVIPAMNSDTSLDFEQRIAICK